MARMLLVLSVLFPPAVAAWAGSAGASPWWALPGVFVGVAGAGLAAHLFLSDQQEPEGENKR